MKRWIVCWLLWTSLVPVFGKELTTIENGGIKVEYSVERGVCVISGIGELSVKAETVAREENRLQLKGISVDAGIRGTLEISLEKDSPWVAFRWVYETDQTASLSAGHFPEITLDSQWKPKEMKALGTAGLTEVDGHSGSYMFLGVARPQERSGIVAGWLTAEPGSGLIGSGIRENRTFLKVWEDFGKLSLRAGEKRYGDTFLLGQFDDVRLGLESYAEEIAKHYQITMKPAPSGYCTWYSNQHGGAGNETSTAEFAEVAAKQLVPWGLDFFQIDDLWQEGDSRNGPHKNFMEHRVDGPYPGGMRKTSENLNRHGLVAGLWFMPFSGSYDDPYYADKQAWFVKSAIDYPLPGEPNTRRFKIDQKKGKPYETFWGGTALDLTHPQVQEYVRKEVSQIAHDWGYRYFKIDGTWVAMAIEQLYVNDGYLPDDLGKQVFYDANRTNTEVFRDAWRLIRKVAGEDVFLMSCNLSQNMRSMGGAYGLVDAMRIGPDNGASWGGICAGPIRGTVRYFYNGRVWWNDPDPVYVRDSIPLSHARWITSWAAITGQLYAFSDWLPGLSPERVEVIRRTIPNHGRKNVRPVDLLENSQANAWLLTEEHREKSPHRDIVALFNWGEKTEKRLSYDLDYLGLDAQKEYVGFDFWGNRWIPRISGKLERILPAGSCEVLAVREVKAHPVLVSTSRHVASPVLEVEEEVWNEASQELSGISRVVWNEPYELRIFAPVQEEKIWEAKFIEVENLDAGANLSDWSIQQNGPFIRIRMTFQNVREPAVATVQTLSENPNPARFTGRIRWTIQGNPGTDRKFLPPSFPPDFRMEGKVDWEKNMLKWPKIHTFGYVLTRTDVANRQTRIFFPSEETFLDTSVEAGRHYEYFLQLVSFDGSVSEECRKITLQTPEKNKDSAHSTIARSGTDRPDTNRAANILRTDSEKQFCFR